MRVLDDVAQDLIDHLDEMLQRPEWQAVIDAIGTDVEVDDEVN